MDMNRRGFLKKVSQVALVAGALSPLEAAPGRAKDDRSVPPSLPIVDAHQHLWDLSRFKLPWLRPPLDKSFTTPDYIEAIRGLNVVKAVYMEVAVVPEQRLEEAEYAIELCKQAHGVTRGAVIAGSPAEEGFAPYVARFKGSPYIKGVRGTFASVPQISDKRVLQNLRLLGKLGLRFDLNVPPQFLAEAARLVAQCPDTRFVLDHCGNADPVAFFPAGRSAPRAAQHPPQQWRQDIDKLAAKRNIICKISGLVDNVPGYRLTAEDLAPVVDHCLNAFGPERVVFASDWPVCLLGMPLRDWIGLLKDVVPARPVEEQRKLFHDNAIRFYDLG